MLTSCNFYFCNFRIELNTVHTHPLPPSCLFVTVFQYFLRFVVCEIFKDFFFQFKAAKIGGCQAISLLATSDYTRRICENDGGWVVFKERSWEFYRESSTGKPLFPLVKSNKLTAHIKRI